METVYNCRRYQYETGEHITFYHHAINAGKEKPEDSLLNKTHDISDRKPKDTLWRFLHPERKTTFTELQGLIVGIGLLL